LMRIRGEMTRDYVEEGELCRLKSAEQ